MLSIAATVTGSPRAVAAAFKRDVRAELLRIGRTWHGRILPRHFEQSAGQRYGYQKRKAGYERKKARTKGHRRPLIYTGRLELMVRALANVTSTSKGVRVALRGPRYLYAYHKNIDQPNKAAELTATPPAEEGALSRAFDWAMTERMKKNRTREALTAGQTASGRYIIGNIRNLTGA